LTRVAKAKPGRKPGVKAKAPKAATKATKTAAKTKAPKATRTITRAPRGAGARKEAAAALAASMPVVKAKRGRKPKQHMPAAETPSDPMLHEEPEADSF
jgi:hypothetical protein